MTTLDADLTRLRVGDALPPANRRARNTSAASENKIHEDSVARDYGFRGGLVPGALMKSTRGTSTRGLCSSRNRITRGTRK